MKPGLVEVFAYQETLLIMAAFGIAVLAMIWVGFRRWLLSRERMDRKLGEQAAEQTAQFGAHMERVEARLNTIEQIVTVGGVQATAQIEPSVARQLTRSQSQIRSAPIGDASNGWKADIPTAAYFDLRTLNSFSISTVLPPSPRYFFRCW